MNHTFYYKRNPKKQGRCPMPWQTIPGFTGKVYVPETTDEAKKHPCEDCFACQSCSDERCQVCLDGKRGGRCSCLPHKEGTP